MGSELELNLGMAKFKVTLSEFVTAVKALGDAAIGAKEKEDARSAIKAMIEEVRKTYDTVVDTLVPLYEIDTAAKFSAQFPKSYASFKAVYLKKSDVVRTHCKVVEVHFGKLQQRRGWMTVLPGAQRAYERLKHLCEDWLTVDQRLVGEMQSFFQSLNGFLEGVVALGGTGAAEAWNALTSGLRESEDDFLAIRSKLGELEALSKAL